MGKIVLLDELTINQIAAGEVIERPASVIKEMVENSIDAGATIINVEIKNGGISYIRIADNGKGIARDDVELAFERHATSKIRSAEDLQEVKSMGFRGEALASIAAIANVELVSKTEEDEVGTKAVVEGGYILSIDDAACTKGTTITVRNLFYNTPVRYKFLKKDFTETGYIEDVITRIALVHPEIAIKLINSGKTVIQTNGNGDLKSVVYSIYGKDIAEEILPVSYEYEYMKVEGVIGKPAIARSNRSNQLFFVNKRYVKDKSLSSGAEQAFKGLLPIGKYSFLILNVEMPQSKVDVNVHPAKLEVRFEDEGIAFKSIYHAIKSTLQEQDLISDRERNKEAKEASKDAFKINYDTVQTGGLFGRKIEETGVTEELSVFDRLKRLQNELKKEVEENPSIELTEDYKKMQEKYEQIASATDEITKDLEKEENKIQENVVEDVVKVEENVTEKADEKIEEVIPEDIKIEEVEEKIQETKNVIEELFKEKTLNEKIEVQGLIKEKTEETQPSNEENEVLKENVEEKIEQVNEDMLSFEAMYKKLFGKEPYGGRMKVEEPKKAVTQENDLYDIQENSESSNISVFDNISEYNKINYKFLGIAFKTYIILEMENELYIMDQHAAHERLLYEKVKANYYSNSEKECQLLLLPDVITLTPKDMSIAKDNFAMFEKAGFMVEEFGENTIKLSGVPEMCVDLETKEMFMEVLDEINTIARTAKQEKEERFLETVACKAAVKANMALTEQEVKALMDELLKLPNPFTCPHGRPTVIKMTKYDIERKFARK